jgi:DNA helicase II / ATP-dependent DNA helicase PcrA
MADLTKGCGMPSSGHESIVNHPASEHGRILAGPGTGKSTAVMGLARRLMTSDPPVPVRVITFTRAATADLVKKIQDEGHVDAEPMTVHAFALSILMKNQGLTRLPLPLRIPDDWETEVLVRPDIARRLRNRGFAKLRVTTVEKLEHEMAAGWESLDPDVILLSDVAPKLRNAYLQAWQEHRSVFGYCLFAEMTKAVAEMLDDHPDMNLPKVTLLVVDEFQDLNHADIAMVVGLASHDVHILAVGDDDQSVYSFRMAAPEAIRTLHEKLTPLKEHSLSTSFRCGKRILQVACDLIETAQRRPAKPALRACSSNPEGVLKYFRFKGQAAERKGVAAIVRYLIDAERLDPSEIAILMRSDHNRAWSEPLRKTLTNAGIGVVNVEAALEPLRTHNARRLLAGARLLISANDGLAWWAYLRFTHGVAETYLQAVADEAVATGERFSDRLRRCPEIQPAGVTNVSHKKACSAIAGVEHLVAESEGPPPVPGTGWAAWLMELAKTLDTPVDDELRNLLNNISETAPKHEGLASYLNQIEPMAKDLALETSQVAIMTLTKSKGLTFRAVFIIGTEDGVIPSGRPETDEEEERRILYVGITRARDYCFLTMAERRTDATARASGGLPQQSRSRCRFLSIINLAPEDGDAYVCSLTQ